MTTGKWSGAISMAISNQNQAGLDPIVTLMLSHVTILAAAQFVTSNPSVAFA